MSKVEERLRDQGLELPPPPTPLGHYVGAVRTGNLVYLSGHLPSRGCDRDLRPAPWCILPRLFLVDNHCRRPDLRGDRRGIQSHDLADGRRSSDHSRIRGWRRLARAIIASVRGARTRDDRLAPQVLEEGQLETSRPL